MRSAKLSSQRSHPRLRLLRLAAATLAATAAPQHQPPRRVLLIRPDHIGDVLLTAPAVALLRACLPDAHLTYLVGNWSVEAARHGPNVDEIRCLAFPGFTRRANANLLAPYLMLAREAARIRRERYDMAVIFRPDHWWGALLAIAAGIPVRVGGDRLETAPLVTHAYRAKSDEPAAKQALEIARLAMRAVGATEGEVAPHAVAQFSVTNLASKEAASIWARHHLDGQRCVAMHPSAGAPLKSWPASSWARLAQGLSCLGATVVLVGAPDDNPLLSAIADRTTPPVIKLCGQRLEVSAAIYARCALVVTVDSGAGHLAAAVGTPTVRLYGPAPSAVFGPWPTRAGQRVLSTRALACVPCGSLEAPPCGARSFPACMLALSVDTVLNAVKAELDRG